MKLRKKIVTITLSMVIATSLVACGNTDSSNSSNEKNIKTEEKTMAKAFPKFKGKDFNGNDVDSSLFDENEATLVNFWFNGCSACVNEMPDLEKFNEKLSEKGAELIGVNVLAADNEEEFNEAKDILKKQGVTYRNLIIDNEQEAKNYMAEIFTFPTTVIVDKNGNIVGDPIVGQIDEKRAEEILKIIEDLKSGKDIPSSSQEKSNNEEKSSDDKIAELYQKENEIFFNNKEVWDRVFSTINKDEVEASKSMAYDEFLKSKIEASKDSFSEDELKILNEDLQNIKDLEAQIAELEKNN